MRANARSRPPTSRAYTGENMLSPNSLLKWRLPCISLLINLGAFGYCGESFSAETHAEFCKRIWSLQAKKAEWDKKHPGPPYRSYEEVRTDSRNASSCAIERVKQAQLEEEGMPAHASSAASAQVKAPIPAARASPPTTKP